MHFVEKHLLSNNFTEVTSVANTLHDVNYIQMVPMVNSLMLLKSASSLLKTSQFEENLVELLSSYSMNILARTSL